MAVEKTVVVKRTIWVSQCPHDRIICTENPPKERYCSDCNDWILYKEESYTGVDLKY